MTTQTSNVALYERTVGNIAATLPGATAVTSRTTLAAARREFEERYVRAALARAGGRAIVAARELGVSRQGLRKLTTRLGLESVAKPNHALE